MPYKIPNNYKHNSKISRPAFLNQSLVRVYCNSPYLFKDANFSGWEVDLHDEYGEVATNIGTISKNDIGNGFRFFIDLTLPELVEKKDYTLKIYDRTASSNIDSILLQTETLTEKDNTPENECIRTSEDGLTAITLLGTTLRQWDIVDSYFEGPFTLTSSYDVTAFDTGTAQLDVADGGRVLFVKLGNTIRKYSLINPWVLDSIYYIEEVDLTSVGGGVTSMTFDLTGNVIFSRGTVLYKKNHYTPFSLQSGYVSGSYDLGYAPASIQIRGNYLYTMDATASLRKYSINNEFELSLIETNSAIATSITIAMGFNVSYDYTIITLLGGDGFDPWYENFTIQGNSTEPLIAESNWFKVISDIKEYLHIEWGNESNLFDWDYEDIDCMNEIYIKGDLSELTPELELDNYKNIFTGKIRNLGSSGNLVKQIQTQKMDEESNLAMAAISQHGIIKINGKEYETKEAFEIQFNMVANRYFGQWKLNDQEFAQKSKFS